MSFLPYILFNGSVQKYDPASSSFSVSIEDRGLQFGDGVYEVARIYKGSFFLLKEHLDRLFASMKEIKMESPFSYEELERQFQELVTANDFQEDGIVYFQISRGVQPRNHLFDENVQPTYYGYVVPKARPLKDMKKGVSACLLEDIRWLRCHIKSLNLLPNLLAKNEAHDNGFYEAVLYRSDAIFKEHCTVTEGSLSNIFMVKNNTLYTHPANHLILKGVTRDHVIALAKKHGYQVVEDTFKIKHLLTADEVFLTGTTVEVMPITSIDQKKVGTGEVGIITQQLQAWYELSL